MKVIDLTLLDKVSSEAKECGISWSRWSLGVLSLNARRGRSFRTRMTAY